jgi:hypothetical protein
VGRIVVAGSGDSIMHIMAPGDVAKRSVSFLAVGPERLLKAYERSGLLKGAKVSSNEQLFDALGKVPTSAGLAKIRGIEGVDSARRYSKSSKGPLHAYWIESALPGGSQKVYFVIDGQETVYLLAGEVTEDFLRAALANLRVVDVP